jgi:hypothetical protein
VPAEHVKPGRRPGTVGPLTVDGCNEPGPWTNGVCRGPAAVDGGPARAARRRRPPPAGCRGGRGAGRPRPGRVVGLDVTSAVGAPRRLGRSAAVVGAQGAPDALAAGRPAARPGPPRAHRPCGGPAGGAVELPADGRRTRARPGPRVERLGLRDLHRRRRAAPAAVLGGERARRAARPARGRPGGSAARPPGRRPGAGRRVRPVRAHPIGPVAAVRGDGRGAPRGRGPRSRCAQRPPSSPGWRSGAVPPRGPRATRRTPSRAADSRRGSPLSSAAPRRWRRRQAGTPRWTAPRR